MAERIARTGDDRLCGLANQVVYGLDRHTTDPAETVGAIAWAVGRLCHKLGIGRETMHKIVDRAFDYSVSDTRKDQQGAN